MDIFENDFGNDPLESEPNENLQPGNEFFHTNLDHSEDPQRNCIDIDFEPISNNLDEYLIPDLADVIDSTEYPSNSNDSNITILEGQDLTNVIWNGTDYRNVLAEPGALSGAEKGLSELYGDPELDAELWHQQTYPDTCAIVSQEFILETYLERDFSEEELALEAISKGYYIPRMGTFPDYVGNLLEDYGIEVERSDGNTIEDIADKLSNNQKIIVGIDANEIWAPSGEEQLKDLLYMPEANHAVMVTGYDDSSQMVYLNDPGHPNGARMEVSIEDFENAWDDSCNFMVSTVNAPPKISA